MTPPALPSPVPRSMRRVFCLEDLEREARNYLPPAIFSYVASPAETGATMNDNRRVFDEIRFVPRVLRKALGTFLRTVLHSGLPHFENSDNDRRIGVMARNVVREFSGRAHLDWSALRRIREQWKGRLVVKGLLHPEDAVTARDEGVDAIVLSNHGGRQLDGAVSPMRSLPAVRAAVGPAMPLIIDSGFRRGTDVLKALALGADFVLVGRPFNYAATVGGAAGVAFAAALLAREIEMALGMLGANRLDELSADSLMVSPGSFYRPAQG